MKYVLCTFQPDTLQAVIAEYKLTVVRSYQTMPNMAGVECDERVASVAHEDARIKYMRPDVPNIRKFPAHKTSRWHLTAITRSRPAAAPNYYSFTNTGEGVDIYIVDTGILYDHIDFEGRAQPLPGWDDPWGNNGEDEDGHGTHVAGLCAGRYSGVAPDAHLYACRVFGPNEDAVEPSGFLEVCNKIILHHESKHGSRPSIVNMSLGAGPSILDPFVYINDPAEDGDDYLDDAVQHLINNGIQVCVAAGNGFYDEVGDQLLGRFNARYCRPARVNAVITVGALDPDWTIAEYSNYGSCVDVFAPGTDLLSADFADAGGFQLMSGTSMACPVVTGMCALILSKNREASPADVKDGIIQTSVKNVLNLYGLDESDYFVNGASVQDGFTLSYVDLNDVEYPLNYSAGEITPNRVLHSPFIDTLSAVPAAYVNRVNKTVFEPK